VTGSPYARALGARIDELHPTLRRYFSTIPEGSVGVGEGVFDTVGTPRRWLHPLLRVLEARGVVWAGWARDVPFRIVNRTADGRALARRELRLPGGDWTMVDAVALAETGRVVDRLGEPPTLAAVFDVRVDDGALVLVSRSVGLRWGRLRVRLPRRVAPVVRLRESWDDAVGRQRVELTVDVPVVGRVYAYRGTFRYRIEPDAGG